MLRGALLLACVGSALADFYISTSGSDSGDGSAANPWATLGRAQTGVRAAAPSMTEDLIVWIAPGSYAQSTTLSFAPADSGANGFVVRWRSTVPGAAVIHGGVPVTGWTQLPGSGAVWTAPLPAAIADARQLYVAGKRAPQTVLGHGLGGTVKQTAWGYTTTDLTPATVWATAAAQAGGSGIEFIYTGVGSTWTEAHVPVASITPLPGGAGSNITMMQPAWKNAVGRFYGQGVGIAANVWNVYALLADAGPGFSFLDVAGRAVYYTPRAGENMTDPAGTPAITSGLEVLLQANGTSSVAFEGLTFSYATWLAPSGGEGYVDMQSGFVLTGWDQPADDNLWSPVPGNVNIFNAHDVAVTNCTFAHLGATALVVANSSQRVAVTSNVFTDVSCGGLRVGQVDNVNVTDPALWTADVNASDNLFEFIGAEYRDCAALLSGYVARVAFEHNEIADPPNTGISMGWGWSRTPAGPSFNNTIRANYVHGSNWLLEDGGSIYVLAPQPDSAMVENFCSCQRKLFGSLYTDEGSAYWLLQHNVVNGGQEWLHIWTSSIHDEVVIDNWTNQPYEENHGTNITEANNTVVPVGQPFPPAAQAIMDAAGRWGSGPKNLTC